MNSRRQSSGRWTPSGGAKGNQNEFLLPFILPPADVQWTDDGTSAEWMDTSHASTARVQNGTVDRRPFLVRMNEHVEWTLIKLQKNYLIRNLRLTWCWAPWATVPWNCRWNCSPNETVYWLWNFSCFDFYNVPQFFFLVCQICNFFFGHWKKK